MRRVGASRVRPGERLSLRCAGRLRADYAARARATRKRDARDEARRPARAASLSRRSTRRGRCGTHGDPRQQGPPPARPRPDGDRTRVAHQGERQHGRVADLERHPRRGREASLGRALGSGHRDGPVDRRRCRRDPRSDLRGVDGADRDGADLLDDPRQEDRGSRQGDRPRDPRAPGPPGRRLLHDPRRRASGTPALRGEPPDRNRESRRELAREVDDPPRAGKPDGADLGRHLRTPAS